MAFSSKQADIWTKPEGPVESCRVDVGSVKIRGRVTNDASRTPRYLYGTGLPETTEIQGQVPHL